MQRTTILDQRIWVIRGGEAGVGEHEEEFLRDGMITVGFGCDQPVTSFNNRGELQRYLGDERQHEGAQSARQLLDFAFVLGVGDNVVLTRTMKSHEGELALGRVTGAYDFRAEYHHRHRRAVEWISVGVSKSGLGKEALSRINQRTTLAPVRDESAARRIRSHCLAA